MGHIIKRQVIFKTIALLLPFGILIFLELILRSFNYGYDSRLFVEVDSQPDVYETNIQVSKLFFSSQKNARVGIRKSFTKIKPPKTFRIFVIGESSSYGFPFTPRASFATMLEDRLSRTFRDRNIEIINLSITAVNSFAFLTFGDEIIQMNPDAVLVYAGHNEYYGAMGAGSDQLFGPGLHIKRLAIYLKKFRITQLLFNFSESVLSWFGTNNQKSDKSFMFKMAKDQKIVYGSDIYFKGIDQYRNNMNELFLKFSKNQIPVFLSTLVSNEKDQKPFISSLGCKSDTSQFLKEFRIGEVAFSNKNYKTSINCLLACNKIDTTYAMNHFLMGKINLENGNFTEAKKFFRNSKELDALRFRAPEAINQEIRLFGKKYNNIHLVDALKEFREKSPYGVLDNSLFMDHLHPNIYGNYILSDAFYKVILETKILGIQSDTVSFEGDWKNLPVTDLDSIYGMYTNIALKEQWPFYEKVSFDPDATNYPEKLTIMMFSHVLTMDMALDSLYHYYTVHNDIEKALKVERSLALEYPHEWKYCAETANIYEKFNDLKESVFYYKKAFNEFQSIEIARKIIFDLLQLDRVEETEWYLNYLLKQQPDDRMAAGLLKKAQKIKEFRKIIQNDPANINAVFGLAEFYLFVGNATKAKKYIDIAQTNYPQNLRNSKLVQAYKKLETKTEK